jgi:hypothetical protein
MSHKFSESFAKLLLRALLVYPTDASAGDTFALIVAKMKCFTSVPMGPLLYCSPPGLDPEDVLGCNIRKGQMSQLLRLVRSVVLDALLVVLGPPEAVSERLQQMCLMKEEGAVASYFCANFDAQQALTTIIDVVVDDDGRGSITSSFINTADTTMLQHLQQYSGAIRALSTNAPLLSTPVTQRAQSPAQRSRNRVKPQIGILTAGDVFVFIFVPPEQVEQAQRMVFYWQRHAAEVTCYIFVKYLIFPILPLQDEFYPEKGTGFYAEQQNPSMRAVLALLKEKIRQTVTIHDIVYVLVGLEAVLSLPQPSRFNATYETALMRQCLASASSKPMAETPSMRVPGENRGGTGVGADVGGAGAGTGRGAIGQRSQHCGDGFLAYNAPASRTATAAATSTSTSTRERSCNLCAGAGISTLLPTEGIEEASGLSFEAADTADHLCSYLQGVVPAISYGGAAAYRFDANIVFSATVPRTRSKDKKRSSMRSLVNVNAFVGVGHKILDMINDISGNVSSYPLQTDSSVRSMVQRYAMTHANDVTVDCHQRAFHATKAYETMAQLKYQFEENFSVHGTAYEKYTFLNDHSVTSQYKFLQEEETASNFTVQKLLDVLQVVPLRYLASRGSVTNTNVADAKPHSLEVSFTQSSMHGLITDATSYHLTGYRKYIPDMRILIDRFLHEDVDTFQDVGTALQFADIIMPKIYNDKIPNVAVLRTYDFDDPGGDLNLNGTALPEHYCEIEVADFQV